MESFSSNNIGGIDFDYCLVNYCIREFKRKTGIDLKSNQKAITRIKQYCEKAKIALSSANEFNIEIESLYDGKNLDLVITRAKFEELCMHLFKTIIPMIEKFFLTSKIKKKDIDEVILVGGSTRIPKIQEIIKQFFNGKDLNKNINLDEAIASGAAIQGAIIKNITNEKIERLVLWDICPFDLIIETVGVNTTLSLKNQFLPKRITLYFTTEEDNQSFIILKIFEEEKDKILKNLLAQYIIDGIPSMTKGKPEIRIEFFFDLDLNLSVNAQECSSDKTNILYVKKILNREKQKIFNNIVDKEEEKDIDDKENIEKYCSLARQSIKEIEKEIEEIDNFISNEQSETHKKLKLNEIKNIYDKLVDIKYYLPNKGKISNIEPPYLRKMKNGNMPGMNMGMGGMPGMNMGMGGMPGMNMGMGGMPGMNMGMDGMNGMNMGMGGMPENNTNTDTNNSHNKNKDNEYSNDKTQKQFNKEIININFTFENDTKSLQFESGTKINSVLINYLEKTNRINDKDKILFLYNGNLLDLNDRRKIENIFKDKNPHILVMKS